MAEHPRWTTPKWKPGPLGHYERRFCRHCDREVDAIATRTSARLIVPILGIGVFAALFGLVLIGPFALLAVLPIVLLALALGPSIAQARMTPTCSVCHREVPYRTRDEAERATGTEVTHPV